MNPIAVKRFLYFIKERDLIYVRRMEGLPKPWTKDKILRKYKFCNVYRERDTVTIWISQNWRSTNLDDPDLWFAMAVARLVNWPDSLQEIGYPVPWNPIKFKKVMINRELAGEQIYSGAYMISTHGVKMKKSTYLADCALTPMWKDRNRVRPVLGRPFQEFHQRLIKCRDLGSFMSGQIIADIKYARPYSNTPDWWTFAASGPGSRRGLNRIMGFEIDRPWKEVNWHEDLMGLYSVVRKEEWLMHAQDLQNCLCEFDKYERVRLGEGRPKSLYDGG